MTSYQFGALKKLHLQLLCNCALKKLQLQEESPERRLLKNKQCQETSSLAQVVEQWTGNPKAAGSNPVGRQLLCIACF